jgi:hypothetical protein
MQSVMNLQTKHFIVTICVSIASAGMVAFLCSWPAVAWISGTFIWATIATRVLVGRTTVRVCGREIECIHLTMGGVAIMALVGSISFLRLGLLPAMLLFLACVSAGVAGALVASKLWLCQQLRHLRRAGGGG